jgi:hypothetical protein
VRLRVLGAAAFFLAFQLLAAPSAHAQEPQSPTPSKPQPPFSGMAHNFVTWLHHVTSTGTRRHRIVSSPPLPRPRPAQLAKAPMELPAAAVEPNTAHPAATAVVPNNAPAVLARTAAEPDRAPAPAVEPNEAQPAAALVVPNKMPPAPAPAVETDRAAAEQPPGAVEQTKLRHRELRSREPIFQTDFKSLV